MCHGASSSPTGCGRLTNVATIAPVGVAFAMGAVAFFTCYTLASARLLHRTDALTAAAWTAIGATVGMLVAGVVSGQLRALGPSLPPLLANGVATATAFTLFFVAIGRLGASRTSVVMTLEAVSAVVLAAIFLGEAVQPLEALGGIAVLAGAVIVSFAGRRPAVGLEEAP
jgi:drug/metabolite transporter (DMT)-like permease